MPHLQKDIVRVLNHWTASSPSQEKMRREFLAHLAAHPDGIWRECQAGHITASTIVFNAAHTHVLLIMHTKYRQWLQLGGHCERADPALRDTAAREAAEECGITHLRMSRNPVQLSRQPVSCHPQGSVHYDVQYFAVAPPNTKITTSSKSDNPRWFPVATLPKETNDIVRSLIASTTAILSTDHD